MRVAQEGEFLAVVALLGSHAELHLADDKQNIPEPRLRDILFAYT